MFTLGKSLFLDRSGCHGDHCSAIRFPGSNGLILVGYACTHIYCAFVCTSLLGYGRQNDEGAHQNLDALVCGVLSVVHSVRCET